VVQSGVELSRIFEAADSQYVVHRA